MTPTEGYRHLLAGMQTKRTQIERDLAELREQLEPARAEPAAAPPARKQRKLSAAGRKAIAEAQRKRWAKARGAAKDEPAPATRKFSAATRKKMAAAQRRRWANERALAAGG